MSGLNLAMKSATAVTLEVDAMFQCRTLSVEPLVDVGVVVGVGMVVVLP